MLNRMPDPVPTQLLDYNSRGLIPGPMEEEQMFLARTTTCLQKVGDHSPLEFPEALHRAERSYGIIPDWVTIEYSNQRLALWHGGCTWIEDNADRTPIKAWIQLRECFLKKHKLLGLYDCNEIIAHELAHIGRMSFEEPFYEELIAYQSSNNRFRQWLAAALPTTYSGKIFLATILVMSVIAAATIPALAAFLLIITIATITRTAFYRLSQYRKCLSALQKITNDEATARAILYRLTDKEITSFGKWDREKIKAYMNEQAIIELRWRIIVAAYCC